MTTIILDIETRPQESLVDTFMQNIKAPATYKTETAIKEFIEKKKANVSKSMSVDWDYSEIICIGIKPLGETSRHVTLEEFGKLFDATSTKFVTFNGKQFDLPVIIRSGIKQGINLPYRSLMNATKKFDTGKHIDITECLSKWGEYKSLDQYLQIYLGISKKPIEFETATTEEIIEHNLEDLENTEKIYNLFQAIL